MNVRAQKSRRRARNRAADAGNGIAAQAKSDPVATESAEPRARTADYRVTVALAAYFLAEKRGFEPGHELDDWLAAEAEIAQAYQPRVTKPIRLVQAESAS